LRSVFQTAVRIPVLHRVGFENADRVVAVFRGALDLDARGERRSAAEGRLRASDIEVVGVDPRLVAVLLLFDADLLVVTHDRDERRPERREDDARGEDELHRPAAVLRDSFRKIPREGETHVDRAARRHRRFRREREQRRAILGLVLLPVHRPLDVGPVEAARQSEPPERGIVRVGQRELA
jgi:hypothetical protein